jgi:hypothetical protein
MRLLLPALLSLISAVTPTLALNSQDNMHAWRIAPTIDKDRLLDQMGGPNFSLLLKKNVRSCLDDASKLEAHAELTIVDLFKVCADQTPGQRV